MTKGLSLFAKRRRRNRTALRARAGTRQRLSVHRSGKHIYAQVIDDEAGKTLASASTLEKDVRGTTGATIDGPFGATVITVSSWTPSNTALPPHAASRRARARYG